MIVPYVDKMSYQVICILLVIFVLFSLVIEVRRIYKRASKSGGNKILIFPPEEVKRKRRVQCFRAVLILAIFVLSYLLYVTCKFAIREEFAWTKEERYTGNSLQFEVVERESLKDAKWSEEQIHMNWYDNQEKDSIDSEMVDQYSKKVENVFLALPDREGRADKMENLDVPFDDVKEQFAVLVNSDHANLSSEELWKGYQAGVEVCKTYENSENVFQTGVLAESASQNAYRSQEGREANLLYTAGMVHQFEKFLTFRVRDAGGGVEISEAEVSFRMEKCLYRVSREYKDYDDRIARHCGLFAYSCAQYAIEKTAPEEACYLIYLNNSNLNAINVIQYIDDEKLCAELCQKELDKWEALEGCDMSVYKTEGKSLEEIMKTKGILEDYVEKYEMNYVLTHDVYDK